MAVQRRAGEAVGREAVEIAHNSAQAAGAQNLSAAAGGGGASLGSIATAGASAVALVFSAISLYHSVLKQPDLDLHVSQVVHYTRDPSGNLEVFAIPLTIANHGARDGTVTEVELQVAKVGGDEDGAQSKGFYSAFLVDGEFFVPPGRFDPQQRRFERVDRPKTPFAPIAVPGRGSFSGTLLFYGKGSAFPKLVASAGEYDLELSLNAQIDKSLGAIDDLLADEPEPVRLRVKLGYFSESSLLKGGTHRLINAEWAAKKEAEASGDSAGGGNPKQDAE